MKKAKELTATHEWTGIMGFSRDEHPWVGPVTDKPGLYIAAGFTGHGMPNTWLCGKAVALMVKKSLAAPATRDSVMRGVDGTLSRQFATAGDMLSAAEEVGLPKSYLVSRERVCRAMELEDVVAKDWAEMERGRRREADRAPSGYA